MMDKRDIYKLVFLARAGFPLDCVLKLREWCGIMDRFWAWSDLQEPLLFMLCEAVEVVMGDG